MFRLMTLKSNSSPASVDNDCWIPSISLDS
jgi:hypothetical protein